MTFLDSVVLYQILCQLKDLSEIEVLFSRVFGDFKLLVKLRDEFWIDSNNQCQRAMRSSVEAY